MGWIGSEHRKPEDLTKRWSDAEQDIGGRLDVVGTVAAMG